MTYYEGELSTEAETVLDQVFSELELEPESEFEQSTGCPVSSPETISCFSRYQNVVAALPATEKAKLRAIAGRIIASHQSGGPAINRIELIGHSDLDPLREKREPGYTLKLSRERALAVRKGLEELINNPSIASRISWQLSGAAASRPVVAAPRSEEQRRRNRRVEVRLFVDCARAQSERVDLVKATAVHFVRTVLKMAAPNPTAIMDCQPDTMPYACDVTFSNNMTIEVEVGPSQVRAMVAEAPTSPNLVGRPVCRFDYRCLASGEFQFFLQECLS